MDIKEVVARGWCVGCGMCAAVCTKKRLEMRWNDRGEYNPAERDGCAACGAKCDFCYSVCPAHGKTQNETEIGQQWFGDVEGIKHRDETGFYLESYLGYANRDQLRENGASGGMATWTLETLLESGEVDAVAAVGRTNDPKKFFDFRICDTVEQIRQCSRSVYYPVETSGIIRYILENEGRYAIIGLPCVCKAVRLAQEKFPKLKERIRYVLGLVCGHSCGKYFAEYLCALGGGNPHDMREIAFRIKDDPSQPSNNYGMHFRSGEGPSEKENCVRGTDGLYYSFMNGYFEIPGCFYCDDVFAECADATFMDAWLPKYSVQPEGYNIVLVRNLQVKEILEAADSAELSIQTLSISQAVKSQEGILIRKRCWEIRTPTNHPELRAEVMNKTQFFEQRLKSVAHDCANVSPIYWNQFNKELALFSNAMGPLRSQIVKLKKMRKLCNIPRAFIRRIYNLKNRLKKQ